MACHPTKVASWRHACNLRQGGRCQNARVIKKVVIKGFRIYQDFIVELTGGVNVVVGANEAGKSTLLEAIAMAMTGHVGGRGVREELNPFWFNVNDVQRFFTGERLATVSGKPEILVEVFLEDPDPHVQKLSGTMNSLVENAPGLRIHIFPSPDYATELQTYLQADDRPEIIPTDYYAVEWSSFDGSPLGRTPRGAATTVIDSRTIRSTAGLDFHTRQLLAAHLDERTGAGIAVALRRAREEITRTKLGHINAHVDADGTQLHDKVIGLQLDQSATAAWQHAVVPAIEGVPFALAGEGQQASIKVSLAMAQSRERSKFVLVEEPENHLSYTRLTKLIARIGDLSADRQVIVTTHSSYVLNRLGLDRLVLLSRGEVAQFNELDDETVRYFKKLSGYDTLRVVLAEHAALVEGPADEMIVQRTYRDTAGHDPMDDGVDVIEVRGIAFKRALAIAHALDRPLAVIRDNDGHDQDHWADVYQEWLGDKRRLFVGSPDRGRTLEPQILNQNGLANTNALVGQEKEDDAALVKWMEANKTEGALKILESGHKFTPPVYIQEAVTFLRGLARWPTT